MAYNGMDEIENLRRQLAAAEARAKNSQDPREVRPPLTKFEVDENAWPGWSGRLETMLHNTPKIPSPYTSDELARLPKITDQQGKWHFDNDPITDKPEIRVNPDGLWEFVFLVNWLFEIFGEATAEMIADLPMKATEALLRVYKFPLPDVNDPRHLAI